MSLTPGARLGAYEIVRLIGAGGMGEVYKARDTRLDRIVAIKVLPEHFAAMPHEESRSNAKLARLPRSIIHISVGSTTLAKPQDPRRRAPSSWSISRLADRLVCNTHSDIRRLA